MKTAEELAKFMHDLYEVYAVKWGWKTQAKCQVKFEDLPEANKKTMIAVAENLNELTESYAKTHAIEYAKYTCNEEDISEQRNREWADDYTEWINQH